MGSFRLHVVASIGTRLALGAYPVAFLLLFGHAFGKNAFDAAAAASNWAAYLNVFLLSGFGMVPPAVARLRGERDRADDQASIRDHRALAHVLLALGAVAAIALGLTVEHAFPAVGTHPDTPLAVWFAILAVLALAQIEMTFWLGVAQATGRYTTALAMTLGPRLLALGLVAAAPSVGIGSTQALTAAAAILLAGQGLLARRARAGLDEIAPDVLGRRGNARSVARTNTSAGVVVIVASLVTIVPVSIVGRTLPEEVGSAYAIVALANAMVGIIAAAYFPFSLTMAGAAADRAALWRYSARIVRGALLITVALVGAAWLSYPVCQAITVACTEELFVVGTLVVVGAGIRVGSLGPYHAGLFFRRPHYALLSVTLEGVVIVALTTWLVPRWHLYALGVAFVAGGILRAAVALSAELRMLARAASPGAVE